MWRIATVAGVGVLATTLAACGGSSAGGSTGGTGSGSPSEGQKVVKGGTFTLALPSDPGNLDPQGSASSVVFQVSRFAYDSLLNADQDGTLVSGLASSWKAEGQQVTLTMRDGVACADGAPFTAADAAANINYVADPANKSPFLGTYVPGGAKAVATGQSVAITLAGPAPFVLEGLSNVPMVCASGMTDRAVLARETRGTGPYQLTQAAVGDSYTYAKHTGYTWGPDGASTATDGLPDKVVLKVVNNETTAANLLLSGGLSAAGVLGPDAKRLQQAKLFSAAVTALGGQMWFNQAPGRPGADPAVRKALTQALDLEQVRKVLTSGDGAAPTTFAVVAPVACPGDSVSSALPPPDLSAAKKTLDDAGWTAGPDGNRKKDGTPLTASLLYSTSLGSSGAAAVELAVQAWKQLGAAASGKPQDDTASVQTLYGSGDWDVTWTALNVSSPDQLVPFLSRPGRARRQQLRAHRQRGLHGRGDRGDHDVRHRRVPDLAEGRDGDRGRRGCRALRQPSGADLRQAGDVRLDRRPRRTDHHPDAGRLSPATGRGCTKGPAMVSVTAQTSGPAVLAGWSDNAWVRFAGPPLGPAGRLGLGADHRCVPDDPPDPGRPCPRRARPDRAGRPGGRATGRARAGRPAVEAVRALPQGGVHR